MPKTRTPLDRFLEAIRARRGRALPASPNPLHAHASEQFSLPEQNIERETKRELPLTLQETYRRALHQWWRLTAQGPDADQGEISRIYQELLRLMDEQGEPAATQLRRHWARAWWQETGVCPYCGERGGFHDPERGGEPA